MAYHDNGADTEDNNGAARDELLNSIAQLKEVEERLTTLTNARERCRIQHRELSDQLAAAEAALRKAKNEEISRLAWQFASSPDGLTAVSPLSTAQIALETAQSDRAQNDRIGEAIDHEINQTSRHLADRQTELRKALAELICHSEEFQYLLDEQTKAFARIRGLRKCFQLIQRECRGQMPQSLADKWMVSISLDPTATHIAGGAEGPIRIPTDETPFAAWQEALENLLNDPDALLPGQV